MCLSNPFHHKCSNECISVDDKNSTFGWLMRRSTQYTTAPLAPSFADRNFICGAFNNLWSSSPTVPASQPSCSTFTIHTPVFPNLYTNCDKCVKLSFNAFSQDAT